MRKIKFQVFMTDWNGEKCFDGYSLSIINDSYKVAFINSVGDKESVITDREKIRFYTGLYDKNQKPIYEHDIVQDFINNKRYEVIWDKYGGMWLFNPVGTEGEAIDYYEFEDKSSSGTIIIGNRYENPELLEVQHD